MKKLLSILLLVSLSLFSISFMVMAADESSQTVSNDAAGSSGANLYLDYSIINWIPTTPNQQINFLTAGIDYDKDSLVLGALYSTALSYNPDQTNVSNNNYMVYGGYDIVAQDQASLGIIASYYNTYQKRTGSGTFTASSIGIGLKGTLNFGSGNISLLYSYGVSNTSNYTPDVGPVFNYTSSKINMSFGEIKGVYYFSDSVGIHALYRYMTFADTEESLPKSEFSGFGLGFDFKF